MKIRIKNDISYLGLHVWKAGNVSNTMGSFKPKLHELLSDHVQ